ncbi:syndetin isoform X2 [Salmo salar]|uniref:Syndetin isoform X2 n=1 Tax=Salmo salar TaxID=8030 RepID=A0A1S3Q3L2_SALSA|nr:syndetin-like isoform X2 [Salmo salar]|eukprot:XP_014033994.1 PREDICTED: syndetin-like isoform X2 [Salmo salar]
MEKIKSLMARQGLTSPQKSMADLSLVENFRTSSNEELREMREQPIDPQAEQEIINSIQEVYYSDDSFDMVQHGLEKLPTELNLQELAEYRNKLKNQQATVSKKVADLILEKQPSYIKELERVTSLQTNLQLAAVICTNARRQLSVSKEDFTEASLGLLANQRRRRLLKSLRTIKTLQRTDVRLSEMLEEQLDVALSKTCKHFDVSHYTRVQLAYTVLGKSQTAMDQVHMHFTQAIHNTMFQAVLGYVELCVGNADTKFQKMQYRDLCTHITPDSYFPCLSDLCKALWEVMLSYHRTMQWHEKHDKEDSGTATDETGAADTAEAVVDHSYVKKKLEHGLTRIWQADAIGGGFCGSKSELLQESIKRQSVNYFKNYHRTRLEELRMFLENEKWERCPVNITQLHEFKFMGQCRSPSVSPSRQVLSSQDQEVLSLFELFSQEGNPFERHIDSKDEETEDVLASNGFESDELKKSVYQDYDSDSDVPDELKQDYVDEQTGDIPLKRSGQRPQRHDVISPHQGRRCAAGRSRTTALTRVPMLPS